MNRETLKLLLNPSNRHILYNNVLIELEQLNKLDYINFQNYKTTEGFIPFIEISNNSEFDDIKHVKVFIGAQHNEYNGLFGILEFFRLMRSGMIKIIEIIRYNQVLYFLPLMNPYGFLNPKIDNKSGYFLKNGTNLNRYWRKTFVPEYKNGDNDLNKFQIPEHAIFIKKLFQKYWDNRKIYLYILDFHETSLLERFLIDLVRNLELFYTFDHWLKKAIIYNIIKLYEIPLSQKELFYKCPTKAGHSHINLTNKQLYTILENLRDLFIEN